MKGIVVSHILPLSDASEAGEHFTHCIKLQRATFSLITESVLLHLICCLHHSEYSNKLHLKDVKSGQNTRFLHTTYYTNLMTCKSTEYSSIQIQIISLVPS